MVDRSAITDISVGRPEVSTSIKVPHLVLHLNTGLLSPSKEADMDYGGILGGALEGFNGLLNPAMMGYRAGQSLFSPADGADEAYTSVPPVPVQRGYDGGWAAGASNPDWLDAL
jgi:hypothetical protein